MQPPQVLAYELAHVYAVRNELGLIKIGQWFEIDFNTVKKAIDTRFLAPALLIPISQCQLASESIAEVSTSFTGMQPLKELGFINNQNFLMG